MPVDLTPPDPEWSSETTIDSLGAALDRLVAQLPDREGALLGQVLARALDPIDRVNLLHVANHDDLLSDDEEALLRALEAERPGPVTMPESAS